MQFLRSLFSKNTYNFLNLSKEVFIAIILVVLPVFYPNTAEAGIFSFVTDIAGEKVSAKTLETQNVPNSQNMSILKAVVNTNPSPIALNANPIIASENALVAEIGPAGTASDVDDSLSNGLISLYVVRKGDTISQIAKMFDISVNTIVWANNLDRAAALKEGQTLVILPITGIKYTVKKGDTVKGIVAKYKADLTDVLQFNDLSMDSVLSAGDTILIPDAEMAAPTVTSYIPVGAAKNPTSPLRQIPKVCYPGYYTNPLPGGHKTQGLHGHNAVDLGAPVGTPIYAAAEGKVIISKNDGGWNGGYGNYVVITHTNNTQTLYGHASVTLVNVGDTVKKGQLIARVGQTGHATGPHLHVEVWGACNPF
jgi:murein DD-endopeptidase MepM/ murein hydrolase activator NlpD